MLQTVWFILIIAVLATYSILDGFDLGSGFWHLFAKKEDRNTIIASISPFWDGNEVWLLTGSGVIFAAFPNVYATVFSGFYLALILLLVGFIFRAIAIDFRNKLQGLGWTNFWDYTFGIGSIIPILIFGIVTGNLLNGIPLSASGDCSGSFLQILNPYSLLVGVFVLAAFVNHSAIYQAIKTKDALNLWFIKRCSISWLGLTVIFVGLFLLTFFKKPHLFTNFEKRQMLWAVPAISLLCLYMIKNRLGTKKLNAAFVFSSLFIASLFATLGIILYPNMVLSTDPAFNLTIFNSSSSELTLKTMLIIVSIGLPFVIGYTTWIYRTFKGKADPSFGDTKLNSY